MPGKKVIDIIKSCLSIDIKASKIYKKMGALTENENLSSFWQAMSLEEKDHVEFWKVLLLLTGQGSMPEIFEDSDKICTELDSINKKVDLLFADLKKPDPEVSKMFLIAYRMELHLLHPAFEKLFFFASHSKIVSTSPEDEYEKHIKNFITAFNTYGTATVEMELLGETIERLWHENKNLAKQSLIDPLTGVFNRRGFFSSIEPLLNIAQRNSLYAGLLMIDIDDFKHVNDSYGHQIGDEILRQIATNLAKSKRSSDVIGRYGGEEFIVYLASIKPDNLFHVADNMRKNIELSKNEWDISVTISIGAVSRLLNKNIVGELSALIKEADSCLYTAKKTGKNKVIVSNQTDS